MTTGLARRAHKPRREPRIARRDRQPPFDLLMLQTGGTMATSALLADFAVDVSAALDAR